MIYLTDMLLGRLPTAVPMAPSPEPATKPGGPVRRTSTVVQGEEIRAKVFKVLVKIGGMGSVEDVEKFIKGRSRTTLRRHLEELCCMGKVERIGGHRGRGGTAYWKVIDAH